MTGNGLLHQSRARSKDHKDISHHSFAPTSNSFQYCTESRQTIHFMQTFRKTGSDDSILYERTLVLLFFDCDYFRTFPFYFIFQHKTGQNGGILQLQAVQLKNERLKVLLCTFALCIDLCNHSHSETLTQLLQTNGSLGPKPGSLDQSMRCIQQGGATRSHFEENMPDDLSLQIRVAQELSTAAWRE